MYQPDRSLNTFGGRVVWKVPRTIILNEEAAFQIGTQSTMKGLYPEVPIRTWGTYGHLTKYNPDMKFKPYFRAKWWLASGRKPGSKTEGNFDQVMGGRYNMDPGQMFDTYYGYSGPMWFNMQTSVTLNEYTNSNFYPANMIALGPEVGLSPLKWLQVVADYKWIGAFQPWAPNPANYNLPTMIGTTLIEPARYVGATGTGVTGGKNRGQQLGTNIKMSWPKIGLSNMIMYEYYWFGDWYQAAYRNSGFYFRNEMNYRWAGFVPFKKAKK